MKKKELERDKFETRFTSTYNENQEQIIYDYFRVVPTLRTHKFYISFTFVLYYYRISKNPVAFEQRPRSRCCSKKVRKQKVLPFQTILYQRETSDCMIII